jgi:hypothetical protein
MVALTELETGPEPNQTSTVRTRRARTISLRELMAIMFTPFVNNLRKTT